MKETHILLVGMILVVLALVSYRVTYALFSDTATATENTFSAAASFPPISPPVETVDLRINEFMANVSSGSEWVEVFNNGSTSVDLAGWIIIDDDANTDLPLSGTISPGATLAFDHPAGWLNNTGDILSLLRPDASVAETHTFGATISNISIGKDVDGTGTFKNCTTATKGSSNNLAC